MIKLFIHAGGQDQSAKKINKFQFRSTIDALTVIAHTQHSVYQGEISANQSSKISFDHFQTYLQQNQFRNVVQIPYQSLTFVSYDTEFNLIDQQLLTINELKQKQTKLKNQIRNLQTELSERIQHLVSLDQEIYLMESGLKEKKKKYLFENQIIDKRFKIYNLSEQKMIDVIENSWKLPNLQKIYLFNNKITDFGMCMIAQNGTKYQNLQHIDLGSNFITDKGLKSLADYGQYFENLQILHLSTNQITDTGLKYFAYHGAKFSNLQKVHINNNKISDVGLRALDEYGKRFKKLKKVNLIGNTISKTAKETFNLKFLHDFEIAC